MVLPCGSTTRAGEAEVHCFAVRCAKSAGLVHQIDMVVPSHVILHNREFHSLLLPMICKQLSINQVDKLAVELNLSRPESFVVTDIDQLDAFIKTKPPDYEGLVLKVIDPESSDVLCELKYKSQSYFDLKNMGGHPLNPDMHLPHLVARSLDVFVNDHTHVRHYQAELLILQSKVDRVFDQLLVMYRDLEQVHDNQKAFAQAVNLITHPMANSLFQIHGRHKGSVESFRTQMAEDIRKGNKKCMLFLISAIEIA